VFARATVRILSACDNQCVFCGQQGLPDHAPSRDEIRAALEDARTRADEVTLTGGEPGLHAELPAIVEEAKNLGFTRIGLQTNGKLARSMRIFEGAGLTDLHLSIHGGSAAAHDYHTGVEGSFVAAIATLSAARAAGLDVAVTTVLTRSNARGLADLARLLAARNASIWCISVPRVRGRAAEIFDRVVPRLGIAMPFALHAAQLATSLRLPVFLRGAPSCVLGPFA
jgi:MoaA/NifB/PqqE/SkfB family radical SAM enzyme